MEAMWERRNGSNGPYYYNQGTLRSFASSKGLRRSAYFSDWDYGGDEFVDQPTDAALNAGRISRAEAYVEVTSRTNLVTVSATAVGAAGIATLVCMGSIAANFVSTINSCSLRTFM